MRLVLNEAVLLKVGAPVDVDVCVPEALMLLLELGDTDAELLDAEQPNSAEGQEPSGHG